MTSTSFHKLSFVDNAQFPVHVRHVHVLRCPADLSFDDFATLLRDELRQCVVEEYPFFSGVLGTGFDGAVQVLDVDVNKVAERVRVDIGTTLHSVTTAQLHGGDVQAVLADWQSPSEEHWTCAARISRCVIDGDDNGVAVGVGVSHRIGDAASVGRFVVRWATRCRSRLGREPSVPIPASYLEAPSFDKSSFIPFATDARRSAKKEYSSPVSIAPQKEAAAPDAAADAAADAIQPADGAPWFEREECQTWRLRFRNDVLKRLQDSADVRERGLPLSRNDFILAATSQAVTKAMLAAGFVGDSEGVAVSLPMDFRGRTRRHAPIPANYFGNALVIVDRCFDRVSEVSDASLVDTAIAVHKAIRAVAESEDEIAKKMSALALGGRLFDGIPPKLVALTLSSWVHSGLHCVDFTGSSHVWATNVQNPPFPFLGHLVPSPGGAGVDIAMALPVSVATALRAHVAQGHELPFSLEGRMA